MNPPNIELTLVELYQIIGELEVTRRKYMQLLQAAEKNDEPGGQRPRPRPTEVA